MKAVLLSCFNYYDIRMKYIEKFLANKKIDVTIISSDFDHMKKKKVNIEEKNYRIIKTIPYYKNMSLRRIVSHFLFSKKAMEEIEALNPDLIWAIIPPNSLVYFLSKYKKSHQVKLIYDVFDLWPETFPSKKDFFLKIPFKLWKNLRNNYLNDADIVVTECRLYHNELEKVVPHSKLKTLYISKGKKYIKEEIQLSRDHINICYLGSINNIIDVPKIIGILTLINKYKKVRLHVIGEGESKAYFDNELKKNNINAEFYGAVFDQDFKQNIFTKCHFGLNIMKKEVYVGLTMKSIEYFQASLPIINNIKGDTTELVNKYEAGINISNKIGEEIKKILNFSYEDYMILRRNANKLYNDNLSPTAVENEINKIFEQIFKGNE